MTEVDGYQPVSRIGEIVMNAFVDAHEFSRVPEVITGADLVGDDRLGTDGPEPYEHRPYFHEWASVREGMICLSRRKKMAVFRNYQAAETAAPVIACAACLKKDEESQFFFAGVARSKSVRSPDDGQGPSEDEYFTLAIGGMVTVLNTSNEAISPGDTVEWTFLVNNEKPNKRAKTGPRRVGIKISSVSSPRVIGRALSFAKPGEPLDLLIKQ